MPSLSLGGVPPPVTRTLILLTIAFSSLYILNTPLRVTVLTLQHGPLQPWTFLTSTFTEINPVNLYVNGASLIFSGRYLERAWGSRELLILLLVVSVISNAVVWTGLGALYAVTRHEGLLVTCIQGLLPIQALFLVCFKQLVPEHTVSLFASLSLRVKHIPALFLLLNTLSGIFLFTYTSALLSWTGFLTAWTYLRFFKSSPSLTTDSTSTNTKGDHSETFTFAAFFPDVLQPYITPMSDAVFNLLVSIRVCTAWAEQDVEMGVSTRVPRTENRGPSVRREEEAERRRLLALKTLDERLSVAAKNQGHLEEEQRRDEGASATAVASAGIVT